MGNDNCGYWFLPPALDKEIEYLDAWSDSLHYRIALGMSWDEAEVEVESLNDRIQEWPNDYDHALYVENLQSLTDSYIDFGRDTLNTAWNFWRTNHMMLPVEGRAYGEQVELEEPTIDILRDSEKSSWRLYRRFVQANNRMEDIVKEAEEEAMRRRIKKGELEEVEVSAAVKCSGPHFSQGWHFTKYMTGGIALGLVLGAYFYDKMGGSHVSDILAPLLGAIGLSIPLAFAKPSNYDDKYCSGC